MSHGASGNGVRQHVLLDGDTLTLEEVEAVALGRARAELSPGARERVRRARALVEARLEDGEPHYGINTGFGTLAEVRIDRADLERLQRNLVLSHAAGVGAPLPLVEARALMLLRANVLAKGVSGIREQTLDLCSRCSIAASCRSCPSAAPSARRAISPRSPTSRCSSSARERRS